MASRIACRIATAATLVAGARGSADADIMFNYFSEPDCSGAVKNSESFRLKQDDCHLLASWFGLVYVKGSCSEDVATLKFFTDSDCNTAATDRGAEASGGCFSDLLGRANSYFSSICVEYHTMGLLAYGDDCSGTGSPREVDVDTLCHVKGEYDNTAKEWGAPTHSEQKGFANGKYTTNVYTHGGCTGALVTEESYSFVCGGSCKVIEHGAYSVTSCPSIADLSSGGRWAAVPAATATSMLLALAVAAHA